MEQGWITEVSDGLHAAPPAFMTNRPYQGDRGAAGTTARHFAWGATTVQAGARLSSQPAPLTVDWLLVEVRRSRARGARQPGRRFGLSTRGGRRGSRERGRRDSLERRRRAKETGKLCVSFTRSRGPRVWRPGSRLTIFILAVRQRPRTETYFTVQATDQFYPFPHHPYTARCNSTS